MRPSPRIDGRRPFMGAGNIPPLVPIAGWSGDGAGNIPGLVPSAGWLGIGAGNIPGLVPIAGPAG